MHHNTRKRLIREARYKAIRSALADVEPGFMDDKAQIKAATMARLEAAVDEKLQRLQPGQGLASVLQLEVVNSDGSFRNEPSARHSPEAVEWRRAIFERDSYLCRECSSAKKINAHHVKSWAEYPNLRFDIDNGLTLCVDCHAEKHPNRANLIRKARYLKHGTKA